MNDYGANDWPEDVIRRESLRREMRYIVDTLAGSVEDVKDLDAFYQHMVVGLEAMGFPVPTFRIKLKPHTYIVPEVNGNYTIIPANQVVAQPDMDAATTYKSTSGFFSKEAMALSSHG